MSGIRLYLRYFATALKTQLAYKSSFIMLSVASLLSILTEFLAMLAFFDRFGGLKGWNLHEVVLFYGCLLYTSSVWQSRIVWGI